MPKLMNWILNAKINELATKGRDYASSGIERIDLL